MDDRVLYPPHVNCETIASTRLILILFVIIHRLIQIITAKEDLNSYPTLAHYRNAASHRCTFHKTYLKVHSVLKELLEKDEEIDEVSSAGDNAEDQEARVETTRTIPCRQRVHGVIPQAMTFGVQLPFTTPKKISKKVEKGELSESVCSIYNNCTGRLLQLVNNKGRQRCALCSKTTSYYCAGCKSWFCFTARLTKKNIEQDLQLRHYNVKAKREVFFNSCYAINHQDAWTREDAATSAIITP